MLKHRNQILPSIIFSISLGILALGFALSQPSSELLFCSADEKLLIVCVRNWLNSAGSLLGLIVAIFAATYAFRQANAAKQQASAALYDVLKERVSQASMAHRLANDLIDQHYRLLQLLKRMQRFLIAGTVDDTLTKLAAEISAAQDILTNKRKKLHSFSKTLILFADVGICARNIAHNGFELAMNDCGIAFRSIRNVAVSNARAESSSALYQLKRDDHYIDRSIKHLSMAHDKMLKDCKDLENKGVAANDRLLKILGLPV